MKRVLIAVSSIVLILILVLFAIPLFFKGKVIELANQQIEKQIDADVSIKDIDLSLLKNIKNFPDITLSIDDVYVIGKDKFKGDTLVSIGNFKAALDIMSVIKGNDYKVEAVKFRDMQLNAIVNKDGEQNWNILKPTTEEDKAASPFKLALNRFTLQNVSIYYNDLKNGDELKIEQINHKGKGDFTTDVFDYISKTSIEKLSAKQGLITYIKNAKLNFDSKININQKENKYSFKDDKLTLNDLELVFDGFVQTLENRTNLDVQFKTNQTTFKSLLSLIPAIYTKDFKDLKSSGNLVLNGSAKGFLEGDNYPNFNLNLKVDNGQFQYPDLPTAVNNVNIAANITHPQGNLDKTIIDVSKMNFNMGTEPISARLKVATPISDPNIDLMAKGKLNLANVVKIYPIEDVEKLSGTALVDLNVKAKLSDINQKNYAAILAAGTIQASEVEYKSKEIPAPTSVSSLLMNFSPQYVALDEFKAKMLNSDFDVKGRLENFIGYFLSKDAVLSGNLSVNSNQIDANQFLPDSTSANQSKSQQAKDVVRLPKNVDFIANTKVGKLLYDKLVLENVVGSTNIKYEQLNLENLSADLLGGHAIISGYYNTKIDIPTGKFTYNITNFDIQQVYNYVGTVQKAAPIMKHINGKFNSTMNITADLQPDLSPKLSTLNGTAGFKMPWANISGVSTLNKIANMTKIEQLKNLKLENIDVKTTIVNGRILVEPFTFKANKMDMTIGGSHGLDETMDYSISVDVPWEELNKDATSFAKGLLAKNPIPQLNNMVPEVIRLNFHVTGTMSDPKISMGKPDGKVGNGTMKDVVKEQAQQQLQQLKEEANQLKEELKEQGKQTLDTLKTQAKEQGKQLLNQILTGEKSDSTQTGNSKDVIKNSTESIKENLINKLPWKPKK